jgi:hypothetical protein
MRCGQIRHLLYEGPTPAPRRVADEPPHRQPDRHRHPCQGAIPQPPLVAAMNRRRCRAAARTHGCGGGSFGRDHHARRIPYYLLKDHVPQVREKKIEIAPDSATRVHTGHPANTPRLHKIVARTELRERQTATAGELRVLSRILWRLTGRAHVLSRILLRSKEKLARPYICRLIILILLTLPSTGPELHGMFNPATTASRSRRSPVAKE